jgi:hypothetical protein
MMVRQLRRGSRWRRRTVWIAAGSLPLWRRGGERSGVELGFQRGVAGVELGFPWGGGLDRVGAESHPFRCVGSARMYGTDGPVQEDPWEASF